MPMMGWSSTAMAARDQHVDLLRVLLGPLTSLLYRCTTFARGLRRSIHLAVLRIAKSLGSDSLMTCFQAEPTWRGSDPDM
jgi:hypothetical protein